MQCFEASADKSVAGKSQAENLAAIRRAGKMTHWRELLLPMLVGLALTVVEIGVIDWLRFTFVRVYGLGF